MIHELVLCLAGYGSSIDESNFSHPSEYHIFQEARVFGTQFRKLTTADSMLKEIIEELVIAPIFQALINTERAALAGSLTLSQVMTSVPRRYEDLIAFTLELLGKDCNDCHLRQFLVHVTTYSVAPDTKQLSAACLAKLDNQWLDRLRLHLVSGVIDNHADLIQYFGFSRTIEDELQEVLSRMAQIEHLKLTDLSILDGVQTIIDTLSQLQPPIDQISFSEAVSEMARSTRCLLSTYMSQSVNLDALLCLLRKVVLLGSGYFCISLDDCQGDFNMALAQYEMEWARDDAGEDTHRLAKELLNWEAFEASPNQESFGALSGWTLTFCQLKWPLNLLFDARHIAVYTTIHEYLNAIHTTLVNICMGSPNSIQVRAFLSALWQYMQRSCEDAYNSLAEVINSGSENMANEHGRVLKTLAHEIFLDSLEFRAALWRYLDAAQHRTVDLEAFSIMRGVVKQRNSTLMAYFPTAC